MSVGASTTSGPGGRMPGQPERLEDLPARSGPLAALYAAGLPPHPLVGCWRGRLLPPWAPQALVGLLPWRGKIFRLHEGTNRLAGVGERFPFDLRIAPSVLDGEPCLVLDYDRKENPAIVRRLFDELREIGPDLYLGPGLVRLGERPRLWTWFALGS